MSTEEQNPFSDPEVAAQMKRMGIVHKPGMAADLMRELAPLLAADGIDLDDPTADFSIEELNASLGRAVEQRNLSLFTPTGRNRQLALATLIEFTEVLERKGIDAAAKLHAIIQPEATASRPAASHLIGTSLGLLDDLYTSAAYAPKLSRVQIAKWRGKIRAIATELLSLARSGRAFDSTDRFILRHGGERLSQGATLLVASSILSIAEQENISVAEAFARVQTAGARVAHEYPPATATPHTGAAFGTGQRDAAHMSLSDEADAELRDAFAEWLEAGAGLDSSRVDMEISAFSALQELAAMEGLSLYDADDTEALLDVIDEFEMDEARMSALDVLHDFATFQVRENLFGDDWRGLPEMIEQAYLKNDPVSVILRDAFEDSLEQREEDLRAALAKLQIVRAVPELIQWLSKPKPITESQGVKRADIETVAAMIGVRARGVARRSHDSHTLALLVDPDAPLAEPDVYEAMAMVEVPALASWWHALDIAEIITFTASRVRLDGGAASFVGDDSSDHPIDTETAATLSAAFVTEVLTHGVIDQTPGLQSASALEASEQAILRLVDALSPKDAATSFGEPESELGRLVKPRALQKLQMLANNGVIEMVQGKPEVPTELRGVVADGAAMALRFLAIHEYASSLQNRGE